MEPEDPELVEFLTTVFHDMRMRHAVSDVVNLSSPDRARAGPYAKFKKQLNVMYTALDPMHRAGFETLFRFLPLSQSNAFSLMSAHCSAVWEECFEDRDIFLHLMYTCSFTYSLLAFSESKGHTGSLYSFTKWIAQIYPDEIEPKLKVANGWDGLNAFCSSFNLHFILDFINLCYNKQGKLFTYISVGNGFYFFGLHHDDTLASLKSNFQDFKRSVFTEFRKEINSNKIYKFGVVLAFVKIELAFDHTASVFCPPSPTRRLLYPTPALFKNYLWDSIRDKMPSAIKRILIKQARARAKQERDRAKQERDRTKQERERAIQEMLRSEEERDRAIQEMLHSEEERVCASQERTHASQELVGVNQERSCADEGAFANQERDHASDAAETPDIEEAVSAILEQDPASVEQYIYTLQQALENSKQVRAASEKHTTIERIFCSYHRTPDTVRKASADGEQAHDTVEEMLANAEQTLAAVKLDPGEDELVPDAAEEASDIRPRRRPGYRLILVKETPGDEENVSDTEEEASHSCSCKETNN